MADLTTTDTEFLSVLSMKSRPEVTSAGITTQTAQQIAADMKETYKHIFGNDVNLDANTPFGQKLRLEAYNTANLHDILAGYLSGRNIYKATGTALDALAASVGSFRNGTLFTIQNIDIVTTGACTLSGLDGNLNVENADGFTVTDSTGTKYTLARSQTITAAGTYTFAFRAAEAGPVSSDLNDITTVTTVVQNVDTVTNSVAATSVGRWKDDDDTFRRDVIAITRNVKSQSAHPGILASRLRALDGVTYVWIDNNNTATTNANGTSAHSIRVVVDGGLDSEVAETISKFTLGGCGFDGLIVANVTIGTHSVEVKFDRSTVRTLHCKITVAALPGNLTPSDDVRAAIVSYIISGAVFEIGQPANIGVVVPVAQEAIANHAPGAYSVRECEFGTDGIVWSDRAVPGVNERWELREANLTVIYVA